MVDVESRKKQVEQFLSRQENNTNEVGALTNNQDEVSNNNAEVVRLLGRIVENQEIDRSEFKRKGQRIINIRETLQPLMQVSRISQIEKKGEINQIVVHFPAGCNALVAVRVYVGSEAVLPIIGDIALDDTTTSFNLYHLINPYDSVRVEIVNHDDSWEHTISVIIDIKSEE